MVTTETIWFAKAATLDDTFEAVCKTVRFPGPRLEMPEPGESREVTVAEMIVRFGQFAYDSCENARDHLYLNSWCAGSSESIAMWKLFGAGEYGVAMKSSARRYQEAAKFDVDAKTHCQFGRVKYHEDLESADEIVRDYTHGTIPASSKLWGETLALGFHKRAAYSFENEWRAALYQDHRPDISDVTVSFDLPALVEEVLVNPWAKSFFFDTVAGVMGKFELDLPLRRSSLLDRPPFKAGREA